MNAEHSETHDRQFVVVAGTTATARDLSDAMARKNVGSVVIVEGIEQEGDIGYVDLDDMDPVRQPGTTWTPVGIVTDRDIVLRVVHQGTNPDEITAQDIMSPDPVAVEAGEGLQAVVRAMDRGRCRRVLLVEDGDLVDIVTMDDVLRLLIEQMQSINHVLRSEFSLRALRRTL